MYYIYINSNICLYVCLNLYKKKLYFAFKSNIYNLLYLFIYIIYFTCVFNYMTKILFLKVQFFSVIY